MRRWRVFQTPHSRCAHCIWRSCRGRRLLVNQIVERRNCSGDHFFISRTISGYPSVRLEVRAAAGMNEFGYAYSHPYAIRQRNRMEPPGSRTVVLTDLHYLCASRLQAARQRTQIRRLLVDYDCQRLPGRCLTGNHAWSFCYKRRSVTSRCAATLRSVAVMYPVSLGAESHSAMDKKRKRVFQISAQVKRRKF